MFKVVSDIDAADSAVEVAIGFLDLVFEGNFVDDFELFGCFFLDVFLELLEIIIIQFSEVVLLILFEFF